jgi:HEAT repeat protein
MLIGDAAHRVCVLLLAIFCVANVSAQGDSAAIEKLVVQLSAPSVEVRRNAAIELSKLGPDAKPALPALITALDDPDKQVWSLAIGTIASIGPAAKEAIPALLSALDTREMRGRRERDRVQTIMRSAHALSCIGVAAIPALIKALESDDSGVRAGAAHGLGGMGPTAKEGIPGLISNLGHREGFVRREVVDAFGQIGPAAVPALLDALGGKESADRATAALALGEIGRAAKDAGPALLKMLGKEGEPFARAAALSVLPKVGADGRAMVPLLIEGLCSTNETIRSASMTALLIVQPSGEAVVPALRILLQDGNAAHAERAAIVLGRLGAAARDATPEIISAALRQRPPPALLIEALVQIGAQSAPALVAAFDGLSPDALTKDHWLVQCLKSIGPPALPALAKSLADTNLARRFGAVRTLGEMGIAAKPVAETLLPLTADADPRVRAMTLGALASARVESRILLPRLETALADPIPVVRLTAIQLVPYLGPDGAPLTSLLRAALEDGDEAVRRAAREVLDGKR